MDSQWVEHAEEDKFMRLCVIVRGISQKAGKTARHLQSPPCDSATAILHCVNSLQLALVHAMDEDVVSAARLFVLNDAYSPDLILALNRLLARNPFPAQFIASAADPKLTIPSMYPYQYAINLLGESSAATEDHDDELVYFVDADCLHGRTSISELIREHVGLGMLRGGDIVTTPIDMPELYRNPSESQILARPNRYWRTVPQSTGTILMARRVLRRFAELLAHEESRGDRDDGSLPRPLTYLYNIIPCLAPMPSLAVSVLAREQSPFTDWHGWWTYAAPDFSQEVTPLNLT